MAILEPLLLKLTNGNDVLLMITAFSLLIVLSFITDMWVEIKKKDLQWDDILRVALSILYNTMLLLGLELLMIPANRIPILLDVFATLQFAVWFGVMAYYFVQLYKNLKALGLKTSRKIDEVIDDIGIQQTENKEEEV